MATMTRSEITKVLSDAGFKGQRLSTAVGIAYAESSGDPSKYNGKGRDSSYGLMQINMKGALGPSRRAEFHLASNDELFNPATNARVAFGIYKKDGFSAWSTYNRGDYLRYMDGTTDVEGGNKVPSLPDIPNPLTGVSGAITSAASTIQRSVTTLAGMSAAVVFVVVGVAILLRGQVKPAKLIKAVVK